VTGERAGGGWGGEWGVVFFVVGWGGGGWGGGVQCHGPAALLPGKTRYPLYRKLVGPQRRSGRVKKI